jgi:hypothetical protein
MESIDTPVRTALMNERALKSSKVKKLIEQSTKKENVMVFGEKNVNPPMKSKKKILGEFNSVESTSEPVDLNTTFEITPEKAEKESPVVERPPSRLRRSKSFADIVKMDEEALKEEKVEALMAGKSKTPPAKMKRQVKAVIKKPVVMRKPVKKPDLAKKEAPAKKEALVKAPVKREAPVKRVAAVKVPAKQQVSAKPQVPPPAIAKKIQPAKSKQPPEEVKVPQPTLEAQTFEAPREAPKPSKKKPAEKSYIYSLYSSFLSTQVQFLQMEIKNLTTSKSSFFELLSEDQQMSAEETIHQGNLLLTGNLKTFAELLENFEADENNPRKITEDDVEYTWELVYEEVNKMKSNLAKIQVIKANVIAVANSKKRRTRRTYVPDEGTPKRSKRIADNADTPK